MTSIDEDILFTTEDILEDEKFIEFIEDRPLEKSTIRNYVIRLKGYCNFLKMSPLELVMEADEEQDSGVKSKNRKINRYLNRYARFMENEQKKKPLTVQRTIVDIKTFYNDFDIDSRRIKTKEHVPTTVRDIPTSDEIKKAVRNGKAREKALILLHWSSGMGSYEIRNLKYVDFLEALDLPLNTPINQIKSNLTDTTIPMFIVRRGKTKKEFFTFCSPECAFAIVEYLEERSYECEYLFTSKNCKQISEGVYMNIFRRINDKNAFGFREDGRHRRFTSHQLRRIFATNLFAEHVDKPRIDFFMGHRTDNTTEAYFKMVPELREDYLKGLDSVTINKIEINRFDDEKTRELRENLVKKDEKIENLEDDVKTLNKDLESMKAYTEKLIEKSLQKHLKDATDNLYVITDEKIEEFKKKLEKD